MNLLTERIVLVHREEPMRNVIDSPEPETFRALDDAGNFYLELEQSHCMVGPWVVVSREHARWPSGTPYLRVWITRPG